MRNPSSSNTRKTKSSSTSSSSSPSRTKKTPCCTKVGLKRGPWTPDEDKILADFIKREGEGRWRTLPKRAGLLRCGKSCRLRWMNYLRPSIKRGQITPDEEDLILRLHRLLGNRWSLIAGRLPGRTDNEIKNFWNTHLSKKLISQGIDPRTHKPLNLEQSSDNPNNKPSSSNSHKSPISDPSPIPEGNPNGFTIEESDYYHSGDILEQYRQQDGMLHHDYTNLQNNDHVPAGMLLESNEDEDIAQFNDDTFSSFLNSLINKDVFICENMELQLQEQAGGNAPTVSTDPKVSSCEENFGFQANWEPPPIMSTTSNQNDPKSTTTTDHDNDHVEQSS